MLDFTGVKDITIPEGVVARITSNEKILWYKFPDEYQKVEYIEGNGNCAIISDILSNNYTSSGLIFSAKLTWSGQLTDGFAIFCALFSPVISWFHIKDGVYGYSKGANWKTSSVSAVANEILEIEQKVVPNSSCYLKVNGATVASDYSNYIVPDFNPAYLFIGGYNYNGNFVSNYGWRGKCYSCTIKTPDGNIIGHFVPCYRKSDGEIGLYNIITNTFCTKIGSGSFTKGANI